MDMNLFDRAPWLEPVVDFLRAYTEPVLFGAGAVGALLMLLLIWRFLRTGELHDKLGKVAVGLATLFAMEGMFEVAHGPLGLNIAGSLMFCATFEIVMLHQGTLAAHKLNTQRPEDAPAPDISRHMAFVWIVATASGVVASTASDSITEVVLRLVTPPLAAGIWYMSLYADLPTDTQQTSWIWTPRRIGIKLGLVAPGKQDLVKVDRDQRIDAITVTAHRLHHGSPRLRRWRKAKLRRLALEADDTMVAEARRRVARVNQIEKLTAPDAAPTDKVDDATRAALDEIRLQTRETTRRLRAQMPPPDAAWSNNVVRIPTRLMDRGWSAPTDQDVDRWVDRRMYQRTDQKVDQRTDQTGGPDPDRNQDQTEPPKPQVGDKTKRRSTPPADDAIPPRVLEMAKALRRRYRGDIPARSEVMKALGWTSADYASKAINLVRAERAERTNDTDRTAV